MQKIAHLAADIISTGQVHAHSPKIQEATICNQ